MVAKLIYKFKALEGAAHLYNCATDMAYPSTHIQTLACSNTQQNMVDFYVLVVVVVWFLVRLSANASTCGGILAVCVCGCVCLYKAF